MGFSIVPHTWLPEKIMADCRNCPLFRRCEQFAMVADLDALPEVQPAAELHV
jgi:N-acetylglutamate synthase-like GNAT family acetyltransferase